MNEIILGLRILLELGLVFGAYLLGKEWLYATIVINLVLVSIVGAKLVTFFGFVSNDTNTFCAGIFFATLLLVETYGWRAGAYAIAFGVTMIVFFQALLQMSLAFDPAGLGPGLGNEIKSVLAVSLRISAASLASFIIAQSIVVGIYTQWSENFGRVHWWLRSVSILFLMQFIDSIIFFFIAFSGLVETMQLASIIISGYIIRIGFGLLTMPIIYAGHLKGPVSDTGESSVSI